jgi:DNA-binding transcriptional ArsR family regulator
VIAVSSAGFTLSRQALAASATSVSLNEGVTPGEIARTIARTPAVQDATITATREALDGRDWQGVHDLVEEHDLDFSDTGDDIASLLVRIGRGDTRGLWGRPGNGYVRELPGLLPALARVGEGRRPVDDWFTLPRLLALSDAVTPTVTVRVESGFWDVRREHRERIAAQLAALAEGADVRVVGTGLALQRFAREHRHELPAGVHDGPNTRPSEARVLEARERFDPDGPHAITLRALRQAPSESATYDALADRLDIARETLRTRLSALRKFDLVSDGYDTGDGRAVDLRPAGAAYLDAVAEAVGEQATLLDSVSEVFNRSDDAVCTADAHGRGEGGEAATADRHRLDDRHDITYLSRREAAPPAEIAPDGGIALSNYPVEPRADRASIGFSYDDGADRIVVSSEWDNPMSYTVGVARALTSGHIWHHVLDEDRLEAGDLDERLAEQKSLLRSCRCLGYLPDRVDEPSEYAARLQDARDELLEFTRDLKHGNHELPRDEFRALLTREALGLAGTAAHLLDLAGVDVVLETRVPGYTRRFNRGTADGRINRDDLTKNLATLAAIMSEYENHTGYRQLLEDREEKRRQTPDVDVDAADPFGRLIPSVVVVGDLGGRCGALADALRRRLGHRNDLRDDAPELAIPIDVETDGGRPWTAATARRLLASKNLDVTREAVSLLDAFARTPYDVADALAALGSEDVRRDVRQSEVRYALAHLDAERLLTRETAPSARRIVRALLDADAPLSRATLTNRADVSRTSTYEHLPRLEALRLIEATTDGYRLALAFHTDEERYADRLPAFVDDAHAEPRDVLYDAAVALVDDASRAGDPDDPVFGPWLSPGTGDPPSAALAATWPWVDRWGLPVVAALLATTPPGRDDAPTRTATFGADLEQSPLPRTVSKPPTHTLNS